MNNEKRVDKLEERLGVNQKAETLEEMIKKFERGVCSLTNSTPSNGFN
jgi:hypothetical protein